MDEREGKERKVSAFYTGCVYISLFMALLEPLLTVVEDVNGEPLATLSMTTLCREVVYYSQPTSSLFKVSEPNLHWTTAFRLFGQHRVRGM